jgi:hypothetical protein
MSTEGLGLRFAEALAAKDRRAIAALLGPHVDFKGLTPQKFWEGSTPEDVLDVLFDHWFEEQDHIDRLVDTSEGEPVGDVRRIGYRLRVTTPDGPHLVEQQAYYRADDRIHYLRVLCSGFRPVGADD